MRISAYSAVSAKLLLWLGSSRNDVRAFPGDVRRVAGYQLRRVQQGLDPTDWKPMTSVGAGVREIRIRTGLEHRVLYIARFADGIYVLHAFEKRTAKTANRDVALARKRLGLLMEMRRHEQVTAR
jgi:phage-related protein